MRRAPGALRRSAHGEDVVLDVAALAILTSTILPIACTEFSQAYCSAEVWNVGAVTKYGTSLPVTISPLRMRSKLSFECRAMPLYET